MKSASAQALGKALVAFVVLAGASLWAYRESFSVPFSFDDQPAIVDNPTIRDLGSISAVLLPSLGGTSSSMGRPVVNLSFAVNYAWGGLSVEGYHVVNLAIHILAGFTLFGIIRRTLERFDLTRGDAAPDCGCLYATGQRSGRAPRQISYLLALATALLWTLHPLLTESVTCVVQRTESLMGLFYLLTLYGFVRFSEATGTSGLRWAVVSVVGSLLGMATKEVTVTAPVVIFLYDRTFVAGSFRAAWLRRWRYYLSLAATWLVLFFLVFQGRGHRAGTAGFGVGVSGWDYALTQCRAIILYLKLAVWSDTVAHCPANPRAHNNLGAVLLDIPGRLDESVAELMEAIRLKPDYAPAHSNLGTAWFKMPGHMLQAEEEYRQALRLDASIAVAHDNLGNIWQEIPGRLDEAIAQHEEALRLNPELASAHTNLATALSKKPGRLNDALAHYRKALRLDGTNAAVHFDFGKALRQSGDPGQAMSEFQAALALDPAFAPAHVSLGVMLAKSGKLSEAAEHFRLAISADPANADAHNDLGNVLYQMGRLNEAEGEYNKALELSPALDSARRNLGIVQDKMRRDAK